MISIPVKPTEAFYLTTAIPYVNAVPHLGHTLEFVQTDAIARYQRLQGYDVKLTTGADENSLKNVHAAEAKGITAAQLCRENAAVFRKMADATALSFTAFIHSSIPKEHWAGPQKLWQLCDRAGDIYKKKYRGLYCVGCESFYEESELPDGVCAEHQKKPDVVEEENYFFRLSKYQRQLEQLIESGQLRILPETRRNEVLSFIRSGLQDFSISRSVARAKGWGVPVPNDPSQIMYVWVDALSVYLTGIGYPKDEKEFKNYWPADLHLIGKGILRFHAVYWPALLLSAGLAVPKAIFVHGYITVEGQKMSKSLGNIVDPFYLIEKYGLDPLRYCLLGEISTFDDGDFSERVLMEKNNSELLANLGNLVNRTLVFLKNNFDGKVPDGKMNATDATFLQAQVNRCQRIAQLLDAFRLKEALDECMAVSKEANRYFQENAPWQLVKQDKERAGVVLRVLVEQVKDLGILVAPFLPNTSRSIFEQLALPPKAWRDLGKPLPRNHKIGEPQILFRKMEFEKPSNAQSEQSAISFADLDIEVGEITEATPHPNAEKLLVEKVRLGDREIQLVSGIAKFYSPEQIVGKKILVLRNIAPAKLRGVESQGMLLVCEGKDGQIEIVSPQAEVGTKVLTHDAKLKTQNAKPIPLDQFFKIKLEIRDSLGYADGKPLFAGKERIKTEKIKDGKIT